MEAFGSRKILGSVQGIVEAPVRSFWPGRGLFMALSNHAYDFEDLHPIDIVEDIATHQEWQFDRIADDQISMEMAGQWRSYSITLAWCELDQTLRLVCSFEMDPPADRMPALYEALNAVNDMCWAGSFAYWGAEQLMAYRYGLILSDGQMAMPDQIDTMIRRRLNVLTALKMSGIKQKKSKNGAPSYYYKTTLLTSSCSITHHGRFGAYSFLQA